MQMQFEGSSNVTLLFAFWNVHGPGGMFFSVIVVLLLTVLYEFLKVWRISLENHQEPFPTPLVLSALARIFPCFSPLPQRDHSDSSTLSSSPSDLSLAQTENTANPIFRTRAKNRWLLHSLQTFLHIIQVVLGYMLMLCVMSYNVWIFLGVIVGSLLGYFLAFPCLGHYGT